ncbi:MAG: response regulator [Desulfobacterales bacterium]
MARKKILILEDDDIVAEIASEILSIEDYEVVCTASGEEALRSYKKALISHKPFHVVLLDLTIKDGMGGYDTMQELTKINPRIKGIVTSGFFDDPIMSRYDKHGFSAALCKPYTTKELVETVEKLLKAD